MVWAIGGVMVTRVEAGSEAFGSQMFHSMFHSDPVPGPGFRPRTAQSGHLAGHGRPTGWAGVVVMPKRPDTPTEWTGRQMGEIPGVYATTGRYAEWPVPYGPATRAFQVEVG